MTEATKPQSLYLLGHPIAHSKSPVMYNAVYERLGLPWTYFPKDCATDDEARAFLDARDFLSVNITTPYKPLAFQAATAQAATAKLALAPTCWCGKRRSDRLQHRWSGLRVLSGAHGFQLCGQARGRVRHRPYGAVDPACKLVGRCGRGAVGRSRQRAHAPGSRSVRRAVRPYGHGNDRSAARASASSQFPHGIRAHHVQIR